MHHESGVIVVKKTYLTTEQLAERIHYCPRTIRTRLKDAVLLEGVHYIRPFGGRKLLFIRGSIERGIGKCSEKRAPRRDGRQPASADIVIPMANGGQGNGEGAGRARRRPAGHGLPLPGSPAQAADRRDGRIGEQTPRPVSAPSHREGEHARDVRLRGRVSQWPEGCPIRC